MTKYEIDTRTKTVKEIGESPSSGCLGILFLIFIIFIGIKTCYNETIGRRKEISDIEHYCSSEQLPKTGTKACTDAKNIVISRLKSDLEYANKNLIDTQSKTSDLQKDRNKKCAKSGLDMYGTEGCATAKNSLDKNYQEIEDLKNKIKTYQFDIDKYKRFGVNGSHIVDTDILNLRNCASTDCAVTAKLSLGEGVWLQEIKGEWAKVRSEKGDGYVANKFLIENRYNNSQNQNENLETNFGGIGIIVVMENGILKVDSVLNGSPAHKFGIKSGDFITKIDDKPVIELTLSEAISKIKGKPGTTVKLQISRQNENPFIINLKRDIIKSSIEPKEEKKESVNLTPLASAIINNDKENIIKLIKDGVNVNEHISCKDYNYENACLSMLRLAVKYLDDSSLIKTIIDSGVKTNETLESGLTEIEVATFDAAEYNENIAILKLLLEYGVPVTLSNETYNLLMAASSHNNNPEIINFLIEKGLDVNYADIDGNTALMYAAKSNPNPKIIETLINKGAMFNAHILTLAQQNKNPEILDLLKKYFGNNKNTDDSRWMIAILAIVFAYVFRKKFKIFNKNTERLNDSQKEIFSGESTEASESNLNIDDIEKDDEENEKTLSYSQKIQKTPKKHGRNIDLG